ncbi:hypothetical protein AMS68_004795 [Peltaster fructicola]|uniref:DNA recombination and repair protein Rad51-like C-terminal domain-containing protein n=1 Tax=Peltaster fructicola TaxID=286661 RepID=A0A6H0XXF4_9PEZI|nr:hypothetical protein AMS68_004795 [Peltaster fructicola]
MGNALENDATMGIVLVSWLNDEAFWRTQLKRIATLDMDRSELRSRFISVDRLGESLDGLARSAGAELADIQSRVTDALQRCEASKALLVLDGIDTLLATQPDMDALQLSNLLLRLRTLSKIHSTVLTTMADLSRSSERQITPLELNNVVFLSQQAHMAHSIISTRELDTGSARDVSGIIRITSGGQGASLKELEKRYLVQRDGSVKIVE